jgi:cytochrome bd-type quinol oxidase subunit 1
MFDVTDALLLARIQFAFTVSFHFLFGGVGPTYSAGFIRFSLLALTFLAVLSAKLTA